MKRINKYLKRYCRMKLFRCNKLAYADQKFATAIDKITVFSWELRVKILTNHFSVSKKELYKVANMSNDEVRQFCIDLNSKEIVIPKKRLNAKI